MVSGSISPRYSRYFSPFLHSTGSLSVSQEYLALPDGAGKFKRGVSDPALLRIPPPSNILHLLGYYAFARHYLRNHSIVFFSSRYLDVSVPWVCSIPYGW